MPQKELVSSYQLEISFVKRKSMFVDSAQTLCIDEACFSTFLQEKKDKL